MLSSLGCEQDKPLEPAQESVSRAAGSEAARPQTPRHLTLGGTLTELVATLGHQDTLVGADTSSTYPDSIKDLPRVGYYRKVSPEGVLSLKPTRVLATAGSGSEVALAQIKESGVEIIHFEEVTSSEQAINQIKRVGELLNEQERAGALIDTLRDDLAQVSARRAALKGEPGCVLFIYARGANMLMVSGTETAAHTMLTRTGYANCITDFTGFKPLTPEAVIKARPEFIVVPLAGAQSIGGKRGVLALPGVAQTPAGRQGRVITVDDLTLLGFGPRHGQALLTMQDELGVPVIAREPSP